MPKPNCKPLKVSKRKARLQSHNWGDLPYSVILNKKIIFEDELDFVVDYNIHYISIGIEKLDS